MVEKTANGKFVLRYNGDTYAYESWAELVRKLNEILDGDGNGEE